MNALGVFYLIGIIVLGGYIVWHFVHTHSQRRPS